MTMRPFASWIVMGCLLCSIGGCSSSSDNPDADSGGSGGETDASAGGSASGGTGDTSGGSSGDGDGHEAYPNFVPQNCLANECPHDLCGRVGQPSCVEAGYDAPFDENYADYCLYGDYASYCVGSSTIGPGSPEGETYCINCVDGEPTFEHCQDGSTKLENGDMHCVNPY